MSEFSHDAENAEKALLKHLQRIGITESEYPTDYKNIINSFNKGFENGWNKTKPENSTLLMELGGTKFIDYLLSDITKYSYNIGFVIGAMVAAMRFHPFDALERPSATLNYKKFMEVLKKQRSEFCDVLKDIIEVWIIKFQKDRRNRSFLQEYLEILG